METDLHCEKQSDSAGRCKIHFYIARSEVLPAVLLTTVVYCDVRRCRWASSYRRFERPQSHPIHCQA